MMKVRTAGENVHDEGEGEEVQRRTSRAGKEQRAEAKMIF